MIIIVRLNKGESMYTIFLFLISFLITIILIPVLIYLSHAFGLVDRPGYRKVHAKPMPFLGGVAILSSFMLGVLIARPIEVEYVAIIVGGLFIVVLGIIDDVFDLKPLVKLLGQIGVGFIPVYYGIIIDEISFLGFSIDFGIFAIPITILWTVSIINAINFIDGLDGLATGVTIIALATIAFITILQGNIFVMMICVILIGSCLGFLVFNFYPARVFLGDNGAMLLGYILSVVALMGFKEVTILSLFFPIIILAVPIIDVLFAMIRRYRSKVSIARADKHHLHHRLQFLGYSHRRSVLIIYLISALYSLASVILYVSTEFGYLMIFIMLIFSTIIIVEYTNLSGSAQQPLLNFLRKIFKRNTKSP